MAHVMKHTKAACGHMFAHFDRRTENIGNESVDRTRTHLNYNLATHQQMDQGEFVRKRCSEVHCHKRKDVNVMVSWVVTAPKDLPKREQDTFFKASYDFLEKRYGAENVVSAYVHMDEVTPHMHFAFVPVVHDQKKDRYKVSAKECVNRSDLRRFHGDLQKAVESALGHEVSILNEATSEGNRSIKELKRKSATERLQEATEIASEILSDAQEQAQGINDSLIAVKAEYEAKKAYVRQADEVAQNSAMYPEQSRVKKKGLFRKQDYVTVPAELWEARYVSAGEKKSLQKATDALERKMQEFQDSASAENMAALSQRCRELEKEITSLKARNRGLQNRLNIADAEADKVLDRLKRVLGEMPDHVAAAFMQAWERDEEIENRGEIER